MIGPNNTCQLFFRTMTGKPFTVEVNQNATTDEIISKIATAMHAPKDKVVLTLDLSLDIKGNAANEENARDVDAKVQEQFQSNIVNFIQNSSAGFVIVKR